MNHPNPKRHLIISLTKSAFRIASAAMLAFGNFYIAGVGLLVAEVLGIIEELV